MKIPTYEQQNKWMTDYLLPLITGEWTKIPENYRKNKETARKEISDAMRTPEVLDSLRKLEERGPDWEIKSEKPEFGALPIDKDYTYNIINDMCREQNLPFLSRKVYSCSLSSEYYDLISEYYEKQLKIVGETWKVSEERHDDFPRGPGPAA